MDATTGKKRLKAIILAGLTVAHTSAFAPTSIAQSAPADQQNPKQPVTSKASDSEHDDPHKVLSSKEWKRVDAAVQRALTWLAARQADDGSFPTLETGQPAVTSLCIMAFLANGNLPGDGGPYGQRLQRALEYALDSQKECGL